MDPRQGQRKRYIYRKRFETPEAYQDASLGQLVVWLVTQATIPYPRTVSPLAPSGYFKVSNGVRSKTRRLQSLRQRVSQGFLAEQPVVVRVHYPVPIFRL